MSIALGTQTSTRAVEEQDVDQSGRRRAALGTLTVTKVAVEDSDTDVDRLANLAGRSRHSISDGTQTMSAAREQPDVDQDWPTRYSPAWGASIL